MAIMDFHKAANRRDPPRRRNGSAAVANCKRPTIPQALISLTFLSKKLIYVQVGLEISGRRLASGEHRRPFTFNDGNHKSGKAAPCAVPLRYLCYLLFKISFRSPQNGFTHPPASPKFS